MVILMNSLMRAWAKLGNASLVLLQRSDRVGLTARSKGQSGAGFVRQCVTLTQRSFVNMNRDLGYYWLRMMMYVGVGMCLGTIFWQVGLWYSSIVVSSSTRSIDHSASNEFLLSLQFMQELCLNALTRKDYCPVCRQGQR